MLKVCLKRNVLMSPIKELKRCRPASLGKSFQSWVVEMEEALSQAPPPPKGELSLAPGKDPLQLTLKGLEEI